jgi:hypothetical protein
LSSRPPGRLATSVDTGRDRRDSRANSTD